MKNKFGKDKAIDLDDTTSDTIIGYVYFYKKLLFEYEFSDDFSNDFNRRNNFD